MGPEGLTDRPWAPQESTRSPTLGVVWNQVTPSTLRGCRIGGSEGPGGGSGLTPGSNANQGTTCKSGPLATSVLGFRVSPAPLTLGEIHASAQLNSTRFYVKPGLL